MSLSSINPQTNPFTAIRRWVIIFTTGLLALCLILWFLFPIQPFIAGVMLGLSISLYNILYLTRRIRLKCEQSILSSIRLPGSGMFHRYLMVTLAIIIAILYRDWIDVRAVVLGLPICYILVVLLELIAVLRQGVRSRKG
ncbi:ATP synthase I chain [Seinonella peptonophila]|uniref:ATP synthase I chain n=1 Tax=Seinonella peptonophila TaxID=112248 RepID=A0A1M4XUK4_9BACL|nr:ATP synthase subunit I [Seinonella peptonophila]SHE97161.1 ATP synthase I chain [Seinonella peptonophila]